MESSPPGIESAVLQRDQLQRLLDILGKRGYRVVGPTVRDRAIVYDDLASVADLPVGWTEEQEGAIYRLKRRKDEAVFGYALGPDSWKRFLHPPVVRLWGAKTGGNGLQVTGGDEGVSKVAFIGVRPCEMHAIAIQDKVFLGGEYRDPTYEARRQGLFVVAVNCGHAGGTCFCVSMNTGPKATFGFDLALTEVLEAGRHYFLVEVGTELGAEILRGLPHEVASQAERATAERIVARTAGQMGRRMYTRGLKELLYRNYESPHWDEVAKLCLTCGNCTMVCPTCFCTTVEDLTDLTGEHAERWRKWDSCFTTGFSYIYGGSLRASAMARYRQWMTHKLATWIDQFGTSGCVGCGRCITWCPVAIDITEEVNAIRRSEGRS
jgi:sulfhydrogenase subunit beta (sulfur reductase)